ncbi:hypothetical protein ACFQJ7_05345 [Halovenus rubra]|uniref:Adhesin n=2 Tax=Halovenus rubra TaxID=869890 RepID=A0ABD5X2Z0_9EURY|nr:hypothetical protein [Halovenus rubra]
MNGMTEAIGNFVQRFTTTRDLEVSEMTTETHPVPTSVSVDAVNGSVSVIGSERDDVQLKYTKHGPSEAKLDELKVHTITESGQLQVTVSYPGNSPGKVDIELCVPCELKVSHVSTTNGRIDLQDIDGNPRLRTQNGEITVSGCSGYVDAETTNGSISIEDTDGVDHAKSVNGKIGLDLCSVRQDTVIKSSSGQIEVRTGEIDVAVTISTKVGVIDAPIFDKQPTGVGHVSVEDELGSAQHSLDISNSVGSIRFESLESTKTA